MTEHIWDIPTPPKVEPASRPHRIVIAVLAMVILAIGGINVYHGMQSPHLAPSPLSLQHLRTLIPAPEDPDAFNEARDGSNALSLEDANGKATIWEDTTSKARIFCLDSCMLLPPAHRHHHHR